MGAWIETSATTYPSTVYESHPIWVRGLKQMANHE